VILIAVPSLWLLWLPLALYGAFGGGSDSSKGDKQMFNRRFVEIETRWNTELENWRDRCGAAELRRLLERLSEEYKSLAARERAEIAAYRETRKKHQLHAYLDAFEIRHAKIKGIGPAKEAALASFGIESAADIELSRLLTVPGFGQINSRALIDWRAKIEHRFVYSDTPNETDKQELAQIRMRIETTAASIRRSLLAAPRNLASIAQKINTTSRITDPVLMRVHQEREQIRCDLSALGMTPPPAPPAPPPRSSSVASASSNTISLSRIARRGANAGKRFWGCSRYPKCRGTRG
jgi:hypothetical protein